MRLVKDIRLFRRTLALEGEIDKFLDLMSEGGILFKYAIQIYIEHGSSKQFEEKLQQVNKIESTADNLRRSIERQLYSQTLIPDARGDVLGLLENLDNITNLIEGTLWAFSIENPIIPILFISIDYLRIKISILEYLYCTFINLQLAEFIKRIEFIISP